ncbi:MAG: hypothetical protein WAV23_04510 [Minisyncoccia bacterium]
MKIKLSPRKKAVIHTLFAMFVGIVVGIALVVFACALLLCLPVLGYHYVGIPGMLLGLILLGFLIHAGRWVYKSIKNREFKALLVHMADIIITSNYVVVTMAIIVLVFSLLGSSGESIKYIPKPIWQFLFLVYYCGIVPVSILFGTFMSFGFKDFEKILEKQNDVMRGIGTEREIEGWKREKFQLKYFNPILLPVSVVFFLTKFLFKLIKVVGSGLKELYQTLYQENIKDI